MNGALRSSCGAELSNIRLRGLAKGFEMCFHSSLPIKDEAWCQFFASFSKIYYSAKTRFDFLGGGEILFHLPLYL
jgi:hypothetical protein